MSELMYTRGDPFYAKKRCNIKETKISLNNNNDYYLTFKTLYKVKKGYNKINKTEHSSPKHVHIETEPLPQINPTYSNELDNNMTEEAKKEIFEQLQTKNKFYYDCYDKYSPYYQYQQQSIQTHLSRNPTISNENNYNSQSNTINTNTGLFLTKLSSFPQSNYSLRKTIITNLGFYNDVERIREKHGILKRIHCPVNKNKLKSIDLFNCSKERWEKMVNKHVDKGEQKKEGTDYKEIIDKMKGEANQCKTINVECKEIYEELMDENGERSKRERRESRVGKGNEKRGVRRSRIKIN